MRSFLGLTNYYQQFIPHFVELVAPLLDVTKWGIKGIVNWNPTMNDTFMRITKGLCFDVLVHSPNFTKPFTLQTDASETTIEAILIQECEGLKCLWLLLDKN